MPGYLREVVTINGSAPVSRMQDYQSVVIN